MQTVPFSIVKRKEVSVTEVVTLYSKPGCVQCRATQRMFDSGGVHYNYVDVSESPEDLTRIKELGYLAAPVVYVDENTHWSGHRPELINKHIVVA